MGDMVPYSSREQVAEGGLPPWRGAAAQDESFRLERAPHAPAQRSDGLERLQFLVETSKILNSTLDLPELLEIILKITTTQTGAERASSSWWMPTRQICRCRAGLGHAGSAADGEGPAGFVAQTERY